MKIQSLALLAAASIVPFFLADCSKESSTAPAAGGAPAALSKVKVGYIGITCEAPLVVAYEKGFFKDEGLDVEMIRYEWSKYKDALALGSFDITHHLIMWMLKPLEQGLDVKFTAGVHTGCLRVQAAPNGPIASAKDLKGKKIGVPGMGTPPFIFANRVLSAAGLDPSKDVEWVTFTAGELGLALEQGKIDAIADSEPIGTMLLEQGKVKNVADQAKDEPYKDEYCCAVIANGKWAKENPKLCAAATRAILKGAKWVQTNPHAAAVIAVEKKYLASNPELNATAIGNLNYMPSISGAEKALHSAAQAMKSAGMLSASTDLDDLIKRAWLPIDGLTDQWVQDLKVEKVAQGELPPDQHERLLAELNAPSEIMVATCCSPASKVAKN